MQQNYFQICIQQNFRSLSKIVKVKENRFGNTILVDAKQKFQFFLNEERENDFKNLKLTLATKNRKRTT